MGDLKTWQRFPTKITIMCRQWTCDEPFAGDLIPRERQLRCYQYLFDIIRCKHVRITLRLRALHRALCSTWGLISENINLIINWYMSIQVPAGRRTGSPLKLEMGTGGEPRSAAQGSQTGRPVWKHWSKSQIPVWLLLSRLCKRGWAGGGAQIDGRLGSADLTWARPTVEWNWVQRTGVEWDRKVVKDWWGVKVGVRKGEKWWGWGSGVIWEGGGIPRRAATSVDTIICFP